MPALILDSPNSCRPNSLAAALWLALPLVTLWPLGGQWNSAVPVGVQPAATVPLFNVWTVWWNADRLTHGLRDYWQAPIFYPTSGTFAFSEAQPTLLTTAPLVWWGSPTLAYNVALYATLVLNGWFGYRLLQQHSNNSTRSLRETVETHDWLPIVGGVLCQLLPFIQWQIGVLQLVSLWGVLWTLSELDSLATKPSLWVGARLGLAFGVTYWQCNYYGLYLSVLLVLTAPVLIGSGWRRKATWAALGLAALVAAVSTGPIVWAQCHYLLRQQFMRELPSVASLATSWHDFALPHGYVWFLREEWFDGIQPRWQFNPGWVKTVLAAIGLMAGLMAAAERRRTLFWGLFFVASLLLSAAPHVEFHEWNVQQLLIDFWPGFAQIRTPYRFVAFAQLAVVVLAIGGLWRIAAALGQQLSARNTALAMLALAALTVTEVLPWRVTVTRVPEIHSGEHWAVWLRDHTADNAVVTGVPFVHGTSEVEHEVSARAMFHQTVHNRRLIEGYSGYFPQTYRDLRRLMANFPDAETLDRLALFGTQYVVAERNRMTAAQSANLEQWPERLQLRYVDAARNVCIYELTPAAHQTSP